MSFPLGQPVPLRALVRDEDGVLDNATGAALTITLPDGTTTSPVVANPPAVTGTYEVDYTPTVAGLHAVRWAFTGVNASAPPPDSFYVDVQLPPLCSLAEAREQCRVYAVTDDALLQRYLRTASDHCEQQTQVWRRQTLTATKDGGLSALRLRSPVISVTSVTESGVAVPSSGWTLDAVQGLLYRGSATYREWWEAGRQNVAVTYVSGAVDGIVPDPIRQGVLLLTEHLWNTQRGGARTPRSNGGSDWTLPVGFSIPNAVLEQWQPWMPGVMVA